MRVTGIAALTALAFAGAPHAVAGEPAQDLELRLTMVTKRPVQPLEVLEYRVLLVNRSKDATHKVVLPNDGSESGWREPHVFWTASLVGADGVEQPLQAHGVGRCGLYATQWWKDVTTLAPGATLDVTDGFAQPFQSFDVQEEGTLRLVAHFAWSAGTKAKGQPGDVAAPDDLGGMRGVAPYELTSKPIDVKLKRFLDVAARAKAQFRVGEDVLLSDVVELTLANRTGTPLRLDPAEWDVSLDSTPPTPEIAKLDAVAAKPGAAAFDLAPGSSTPLVGAAGLAAGRDQRVRFAKPGIARLALWICRRDGASRRIRSNWVDVEVLPGK
jgi:hypothetical protein